jgi:hypothetical protein
LPVPDCNDSPSVSEVWLVHEIGDGAVLPEWWLESWLGFCRGRLFPVQAVSLPRARAARTGSDGSPAELEMGGVECAGMPPFPATSVRSFDQLPGELGSGDPDARSKAGILVRALALESRLAYTRRKPFA